MVECIHLLVGDRLATKCEKTGDKCRRCSSAVSPMEIKYKVLEAYEKDAAKFWEKSR